jgi:hypothetical protein
MFQVTTSPLKEWVEEEENHKEVMGRQVPDDLILNCKYSKYFKSNFPECPRMHNLSPFLHGHFSIAC